MGRPPAGRAAGAGGEVIVPDGGDRTNGRRLTDRVSRTPRTGASFRRRTPSSAAGPAEETYPHANGCRRPGGRQRRVRRHIYHYFWLPKLASKYVLKHTTATISSNS